jgi:TetR/AcrR family transcriptional repressor of bet genes
MPSEPDPPTSTGTTDTVDRPAVRRTAPRELRRRQLIEATVASIAERGFAETKMADVAAGAGLSAGIVNFHFKSKEALLAATLEYIYDEYRRCWSQALSRAGNGPAARLAALVDANFEPSLCRPERMAVWLAFLGEARSRPAYHALCQRDDDMHLDQLVELFRSLNEQLGSSPVDPDLAAMNLMSLWDGLWQNMLMSPQRFSRAQARAACFAFLEALYPGLFGAGSGSPG